MKRKFLFCLFFVFFSLVDIASAGEENLALMRVTLPFGWEVTESSDTQVILETENKDAKFIYKKIPIHYLSLEDYARGLSRAYGGYNFQKRTSTIYFFEYLHGGKFAWTLVTLYKNDKNTVITQTGIGESRDYVAIMESIKLK